ncbi:hypothetical protein SAMN02745181_0327 [Rubritalea squalenifaciens DSM 18772]|uniref:Uncharacterized protein n=1 Tax=Rubritalea squalenifaciens DSM 18772 TaxID=1123071 RepID=A0A1M6BWD8_9BACT|nr:hypothetical protein [Rubritalea squalenifaciens]SHI53092.1 hypothetical protein SAMN02745181_0327 [Rubritalea squalenifaciens DSM 18772]
MKERLKRFLSSRPVWYFLGLLTFPILSLIWTLCWPSPKDAMGLFPGYYEEYDSTYTFNGDHEYSLKFPGDREKFLKFVRAMDLEHHKLSDTEYKEAGSDWERSAVFVEDDQLRTIRYSSSSH